MSLTDLIRACLHQLPRAPKPAREISTPRARVRTCSRDNKPAPSTKNASRPRSWGVAQLVGASPGIVVLALLPAERVQQDGVAQAASLAGEGLQLRVVALVLAGLLFVSILLHGTVRVLGKERTLTQSSIRFAQSLQFTLWWPLAATLAARTPRRRRLRIWWSIFEAVCVCGCWGVDEIRRLWRLRRRTVRKLVALHGFIYELRGEAQRVSRKGMQY